MLPGLSNLLWIIGDFVLEFEIYLNKFHLMTLLCLCNVLIFHFFSLAPCLNLLDIYIDPIFRGQVAHLLPPSPLSFSPFTSFLFLAFTFFSIMYLNHYSSPTSFCGPITSTMPMPSYTPISFPYILLTSELNTLYSDSPPVPHM